jgi:hypothetical protein
MRSAEYRPFTAATNKFAYAQVFTRASIRRPDDAPIRREHRLHLPTLRRARTGA